MKRIGYPLAAMVVVFLMVVTTQAAAAATSAVPPDSSTGALYIDPGTGSIIIQALIGVLVGGVAMMGIYRVRVKNFLVNLFSRRKGNEDSEEGEPAE